MGWFFCIIGVVMSVMCFLIFTEIIEFKRKGETYRGLIGIFCSFSLVCVACLAIGIIAFCNITEIRDIERIYVDEYGDVRVYTDALKTDSYIVRPEQIKIADKNEFVVNWNIFITPNTLYVTEETYNEIKSLMDKRLNSDFIVGSVY